MHLWTQNAKTAQIRRSEMNGFMLIWALPKPHANTNCVLDNAFCGYAIFQIATSLRLQRERCSITGNSEMVMLHQEERRNGNGIPMANLIRRTECCLRWTLGIPGGRYRAARVRPFSLRRQPVLPRLLRRSGSWRRCRNCRRRNGQR